MTLRPLAAIAFAATLTLGACSSGGSDAADPTTTDAPATTSAGSETGDGGGGTEVTIADFAFDPGEIEVSVGDTVTFTNEDSAAHTATSKEDDPASFDTGDIEGDGTAEVTFDEAGDYAYYCSIHDYMTGTIRVLE